MAAAATKPRSGVGDLKVTVNGAALPNELQKVLIGATLEDSIHNPDLLELVFEDTRRAVASGTKFKFGDVIKVDLGTGGLGKSAFTGEVVALVARLEHGESTTVVRCMDQTHRLHRGRVTKTWQEKTLGAAAKDLCSALKMDLGAFDVGGTTHPFVSIVNETPYQFIKRACLLENRELVWKDGKVSLQEVKPGDEEPVEIQANHHADELEATISSSGQVPEVIAGYWDVNQNKAEKSTAKIATALSTLPDGPAKLASAIDGTSTTTVTVGTTVAITQPAEAKAMATAVSETIASTAHEAHGVVEGDPRLRAGRRVKLKGLGAAFEGELRLTTTRHRWSPHRGYSTEFTVTGRADRSLGGLIAAGAQRASMNGVATAVVDDNADPEEMGRVRIKMPWLSEDHVSGWVRVAYPGAAKDRGLAMRPSKDDEVLVAFQNGDPRTPVVIGGLYNGQKKVSELEQCSGGEVPQYGLFTDTLSAIFDDKKEALVIGKAKDAGHAMTIDGKGSKVLISSAGEITIKGAGAITVQADGGDLTLKSSSKVAISAPEVAINASTSAKVVGGSSSVDLGGAAKVSGPSVSLG